MFDKWASETFTVLPLEPDHTPVQFGDGNSAVMYAQAATHDGVPVRVTHDLVVDGVMVRSEPVNFN